MPTDDPDARTRKPPDACGNYQALVGKNVLRG